MTRSPRALLAVLLLAVGCSRGRAGAPSKVPVTIARAEQRAVPYEIMATGTVEPRQTVSVQSQRRRIASSHVRSTSAIGPK